jgi:hypothetical protein
MTCYQVPASSVTRRLKPQKEGLAFSRDYGGVAVAATDRDKESNRNRRGGGGWSEHDDGDSEKKSVKNK